MQPVIKTPAVLASRYRQPQDGWVEAPTGPACFIAIRRSSIPGVPGRWTYRGDGRIGEMDVGPDHGEQTDRGTERLQGGVDGDHWG